MTSLPPPENSPAQESTTGRQSGRRIRESLDRPEYKTLFTAVRDRIEESGAESARSVTLTALSDPERKALADLHGWKTIPKGPVRIVLAKLDEALKSSNLQSGLVDVVEALGGPLKDRRAEKEAARTVTARFWSGAASHPVVLARPELPRWIKDMRQFGLLRRAARGTSLDDARLLDLALQVVGRLPAHSVLLAVLATETAGDAHALDTGRPLATLVLRAAACLAGWNEVPATAVGVRRLWSEVGVLCDPLSANVLVLGLRPAGSIWLARQLRESAEAGEPRRITLRELTRCPLAVQQATDIFVCENPAIVASAAEELGGRAAPLVCVEGVPSTAAIILLEQLNREGGRIRFHADFDWGGVRIGNLIETHTRGSPWRFSSADYKNALAASSEAGPLRGVPVSARWDVTLREAMSAAGRAVFEEHVIASLLDDLRFSSPDEL